MALQSLRAADQAGQPRSWDLLDQIKRAAVSVEANIVEGYALGTTAQFKRHLRIALASAAEAETLLRLAAEAEYMEPEVCEELTSIAGHAMAAIQGLLRRPRPSKP